MPEHALTLGHSPDPDDAFMFCGLSRGRVDAEGLCFEHVLQDIQTLNERAERSELDVTALSLHAYAYLHDRWQLSSCGASVGDGYGPLVVSRHEDVDLAAGGVVVHVPGLRTTAHLALQLYAPRCRVEVMPFDEILPAVARGEIEHGLIIHEGQITFAEHDVKRVVDLGAWWKEETGLPLVLGVNAARRDLSEDLLRKIQRVLRRSIEWGLAHRAEAVAHARAFGRGIDDRVTDRFVGMYVNDFTVDLGERGRRAARALLDRAAEAGLVPGGVPLDPIPQT